MRMSCDLLRVVQYMHVNVVLGTASPGRHGLGTSRGVVLNKPHLRTRSEVKTNKLNFYSFLSCQHMNDLIFSMHEPIFIG